MLLSVADIFHRHIVTCVYSHNVSRFTCDLSRRTWILKRMGVIAAINMPNITRLQGGTSLCIRTTSCLTHPRCTQMMDFTHASEYLNRIHNKIGLYRPTQKAQSAKLFELKSYKDGNNVRDDVKQKAGELIMQVS